MTTTSALMRNLHRKNNSESFTINHFYFKDHTSFQKNIMTSNIGLKQTKTNTKLKTSISPMSARNNHGFKPKITVTKNTIKQASSPLYRTINPKKTLNSSSKDSRAITPSSRSISVNQRTASKTTKYGKIAKFPTTILNNIKTISNTGHSCKTPVNISTNFKRKVQSPSPSHLNMINRQSKTKTPIGTRDSTSRNKDNNNKSSNKSPLNIRDTRVKANNKSKLNSNTNSFLSTSNQNNKTHHSIHSSLQKRPTKTRNIKINPTNNMTTTTSLMNFKSISTYASKKPVIPSQQSKKQKSNLRHISITTKLKSYNMEDNSIKSSTSRNLTPNQLTAIRTPVSMVNSTRADSMSSKSIPLTKKITNIAHITKTGFNGFHRKGPQKVNQDNFFINTFDEYNISFIGVCDGHGANGHLVSAFLKEYLPMLVHKELKEKIPLSNQSQSSFSKIKSTSIHKIIENAFILTNSKLSNSIDIDTNFSGSTCSSVLLTHDGFFTSNVGDSRSIKGTYLNSKWNFEQLSRDHKATETDEANRVIRFGGRIEPFKEKDGTYAGPKRVWLKKEQIPGLAMTRSFGDQVASSVGVVCEPEIRNFFWKEEDKFIVIASDGLWEYVSNKEVVDIVGRYYAGRTADKACDSLYSLAHQRWRENDDCIDDITIIVMFLD